MLVKLVKKCKKIEVNVRNNIIENIREKKNSKDNL